MRNGSQLSNTMQAQLGAQQQDAELQRQALRQGAQQDFEPGHTKVKLPEAAAAEVRRLSDRIRAGREHLGILDFEKAKLEAQSKALDADAASTRQKLQSDLLECDTVLQAAARELGLAEPGWKLDLATGEFSR